MNFRFNLPKATEVACEFLERAGGQIHTMTEHGERDQWQLVDWCHTHCGEWTPMARGCAPIAVERMGQALGKPPEAVARLAREAAELNQLDEIFAGA